MQLISFERFSLEKCGKVGRFSGRIIIAVLGEMLHRRIGVYKVRGNPQVIKGIKGIKAGCQIKVCL